MNCCKDVTDSLDKVKSLNTIVTYENAQSKFKSEHNRTKICYQRRKVTKHNYGANNYEPETCPICFENINLADMVMLCPKRHYFHLNCLTSWVAHKSNPFKGRDITEKPKPVSCTCPVCRDKLAINASKMINYVNNPEYQSDDRNLFQKLVFRLKIVKSALQDKNTCERFLLDIFVLLFGFHKGITLEKWNFLHLVFFYLLPLRMRIVTSSGFSVGFITRIVYKLYLKMK